MQFFVDTDGDSGRAMGFDCVGIGVGPSNLSLASLLHGRPGVRTLFLDKKEQFTWHDGQQIVGSTLQVSMLKDLVSLADPTNRFSFLSYLHETGRIYHFLNARFDAVQRREFRDYMEWAANRNENVVFGEEVREVDFDGMFRVRTDRRTIRAANISVAVGTVPWLPPQAPAPGSPSSFHVSEHLAGSANLGGLRVAVIGGGQSGAEAFLDLISRPEGARPRRVSWVSRRANFLPIDDSAFTNDWYMPDFSDYFAAMPRGARAAFNERHLLTSDGITESTLRDIYQRVYAHRFLDGAPDLAGLYPNREVTRVRPGVDGAHQLEMAHGDHPGVRELLDADVLVWATGYRPAPMPFLDPLAGRLEREQGEIKIDSHFAAVWDGPPQRRIFVQNGARGQRGLADPNLSLLAWRNQRIVDRLTGTDTRPQLGSFVDWSSKPAVTLEGV